jgi:AcrR family transcriptional regulator
MMGTAKNEQLTRDDWVAVARKAMIASGVDDVKVDVLARRLKVTRGSFYWHFESRQDLLDALLEDWESTNRREIATVGDLVEKEGKDGLVGLFRVWLAEDPSFPAFDIAIRGWARKTPKISEIVREIDDAWIDLLRASLERGGITFPESLVRARIMYFHQVGYFALALKEDRASRVKLSTYYYNALTGLPAPKGLMDALLPIAQGKSAANPARVPARARKSTAKKRK